MRDPPKEFRVDGAELNRPDGDVDPGEVREGGGACRVRDPPNDRPLLGER